MSAVTLVIGAESTLSQTQAHELRYSPREIRWLHAGSLLVASFVIGNAVLAGRYPAYMLWAFFANAFSAVRYSGYIHALNHAHKATERVHWSLELILGAWSPFILGFAETQRIHLAHHRYETGAGDPDNFVTDCRSRPLALLKCAFMFEYWFVHAVRQRWLTSRFWPLYLCRLAIFVGVFYCAGTRAALISYVLAIKVGTAISFFNFSYLAHVQGNKRDNYMLAWPRAFSWLSRALIGKHAADTADYHAVHHARPWVSTARLDQAFALLRASGQPAAHASQPR